MSTSWALVAALLRDACGPTGAFPGCVAAVVVAGELVFHEAFGDRALDPVAEPATRETRYDLASLTKPVVASLVAQAVVDGRLGLEHPVGPHATLRQALGHASGWPAVRDFSQRSPAAIREAVLAEPLERPPGSAAVYSDLGYMALGWALEAARGRSLPELLDAARDDLRLGALAYGPSRAAAPTERCARRGLLRGEVHDPNAWALGGVAGHAGLFGTARDVAGFGQALLHHTRAGTPLGRALLSFWSQSAAEAPTTWRLGFDTPSLTGSSAGSRFGPGAVGHLGFTGTSLWLDPKAELVVVLLSNRVHPRVDPSPVIRQLRPRFHDAVREALGG